MSNYNEKLGEVLANLVNQVAANEQRLLNGNATRKATIDSDRHATTQAKQAIIDWHNKQVEEAMAKFHLKRGVKYDVKASNSVIVITHTNKLKGAEL